MGLAWFWDFGWQMPNTDYNVSDWSLSTTNGTTLNPGDTSQLASPVNAGITPGDRAVCRSGGTIDTPIFTGISTGWAAFRCQILSTPSSIVTLFRLLRASSSVPAVELRANGSPATPFLYTDGVLTSSGTSNPITINDTHWYSVKFDISTTFWEVSGYIDGVLVCPVAGRTETQTDTVIRMGMSSANTTPYSNTWCMWDSHSVADEEQALNINLWSSVLFTMTAANTTDWTLTGGAAGITEGLGDTDGGSGLAAATATSIDLTFETRNQRLAGWAPTNILGVMGVCYASADLLNNVTMLLSDGGGNLHQANHNPLPQTPEWVGFGVCSTTNSSGNPITGTDLDALGINFSIA